MSTLASTSALAVPPIGRSSPRSTSRRRTLAGEALPRVPAPRRKSKKLGVDKALTRTQQIVTIALAIFGALSTIFSCYTFSQSQINGLTTRVVRVESSVESQGKQLDRIEAWTHDLWQQRSSR